jgi:hypothetical protein
VKLYRPATILVGVLFVLLGGLTRLATPDQVYDEENIKVVHGTIGQPLDYTGSGSTVEVTRIAFAQSVLDDDANDDDKPLDTNGVYVAIEWDAVRGPKKPDIVTATLEADGGSVYQPVTSGINNSNLDFPDAGFGRTGAIVFEVNPSDLKNLTLRLRPTMLFNVYNSEIEVDLGIPTEKIAQQLLDKAVAQYVVPSPANRVAS